MGFWIFMLIFNLLFPFTMIGFGSHSEKKAPNEINNFYGYRTTMSMKNMDTWAFAHQHIGRLWRRTGWIMLPATVIAMLFVIGKDIRFIGIYGIIICGVQLAVLIGSIFPTERALKKTFDEFGRRRK